MEQPHNAQHQLLPHHSVLVIQHPSFLLVTTTPALSSTDGGVRCWGSNNNGQLGDGTSTDRSSPPSSDINLGSGYTAIGVSAGGGHTCAMLQDGDMKCWGARGGGQLGDDSNFASGDQLTPVFVHGSITFGKKATS